MGVMATLKCIEEAVSAVDRVDDTPGGVRVKSWHLELPTRFRFRFCNDALARLPRR
jgi:hypothetical protein